MSDKKNPFQLDAILKKNITRKQFLGLGVVAAASVFGITRIFKDIHGYAATIVSPGFETEKGTVTGGAVVVADSSASDSQAVSYSATPVTPVNPIWSATNTPWSIGGLTDDWPSSATTLIESYTDSRWYSSSKTFVQILDDMCSIAGPCIAQLPAGDYHITSFSYRTFLIGNSTDGYSSIGANGYYNTKLRGLLGSGVGSTNIIVDSGALGATLISEIARASAAMSVNAFGLGTGSGDTNAYYMAGINFIGQDQGTITAANILKQLSGSKTYVNQPAPWGGFVAYGCKNSLFQNLRFQGFGHAMTNSPPYETGGWGSQYCSYTLRRFEIDGRNPATQVRRSGGLMLNGEVNVTLEDGWIHHAARSGYTNYGHTDNNVAAAQGSYTTNNVLVEHNANVDDGLGGAYTFTGVNHEEIVGKITHNNPNISYDNATWIMAHMYFGANDTLGNVVEAHINEPVWSNSFANDNGCFSIHVSKTYGSTNNVWFSSTAVPVTVIKNGVTLKQCYVGTGQVYGSNVSAATLQAAGITASTYFLVKVS